MKIGNYNTEESRVLVHAPAMFAALDKIADWPTPRNVDNETALALREIRQTARSAIAPCHFVDFVVPLFRMGKPEWADKPTKEHTP